VTTSQSPHDWSELASLIDVLLDAPPEQRPALIGELSAGNAARRAELERLLMECEREPALFSRPAAERFARLLDDEHGHFPDALAPRYRPTKEIGRGGMATVYLAHDVKHAREVAVKVVHPSIASSIGADRFLREIEIAARLHHPHVVPLYDSGEADGLLYYVMPYEGGASLRHRLAREGPLALEDAVAILRDVCDGLAYAHQHGVIHRDIKPDNVLLSGRHALLTDFGIAKAATDAAASTVFTAVGVTLGTPAYMAPEQIAGDGHVDHRADIYSVGVMAYELLTGRPPFDGETRQDVLSAHLTNAPALLSTHRPDVPRELSDLVMKCLEKRAAERWQSAEDLVQRLEALPMWRSAPSLRRPIRSRRSDWLRRFTVVTAGIAIAALSVFLWRRRATPEASWRARWANARIAPLTDFAGSEVDAAISANGQFVAFLADRDSVFDAFVTQVGSEQFVNLTGGRLPQLFNEDVRNIGFSADAAHVWIRVADITSPASVSMVPTLGGAVRPFLNTAVMAVWSPDGTKVAYHETTPGDPVYVADADGGNARQVFAAVPGVHSHHVAWSPDGRFLYFSRGMPPDEMDIWRIAVTGGPAERITNHNSRVAYPTLLDDRTLFYTATADDGTGPWLYSMDVDERVAHRVSTAVEHYTSIAASAASGGQPRRLVATVSNPVVQLWSVPITSAVATEQDANRVELPTARSLAPRFSRDSSVWYLASRGGADGLWRLSAAGQSAEVWKPTDGALVGAAAVSSDGRTVCVPVRRQGRSTLTCANTDGTGARTMAESLDVRGAASWSPDGRWLVVAAREGTSVRLFKIPRDGGAPVRLVDSVATNPVWSPDGTFIVYSGTPRARSVPLKAVTPDGRPYPLPTLSVDRVGDSYRFLPNGKELVFKAGGFRRQNLWLVDVATGHRRPLTALKPGESLQRFDVSPDGKRILFERVRENSDVVLIELPRR
jgi:Tol biopolymer transport system component/tRNA A-37 threonylcarbamoyl transferase component Bud32